MRSQRIEAHRCAPMDAFEEGRDHSLEELEARLGKRCMAVSNLAPPSFMQRHGIKSE
ncbi:MAG: hypothetical protein AAF416_21705 [Pseudomonadota bacterium]